jgi:hypothetical protein
VPFTGSHPAAILPFLRTPLPASALVAGSIAPDLPYYVPVDFPLRTHTALSVVSTDLVLGLVAWALWHGVLAAPALAASPAGLRARLTGLPDGLGVRLPRLGWVLAALAVGAATHVLWDEFTHPRRWGTEHIPALAQTWGPLAGYRWLQYASGLVGLVVLLVWFVRWWRRTAERPVAPGTALWAWLVLAGVGGVAGCSAALSSPSIGTAGFAGATWGGGAALAAAVVLAIGWHARRLAA